MGKTPEERIGVNESDIKTLKDSDQRQWDVIDRLQNRLPVWATIAISLLTFLLGGSVTFAGMVIRMNGQ